MPSSPNTSCNFGDMQNTDYCLGIERIEHDQSLVGPVLSVREASPEAKRKKKAAVARGSMGQQDGRKYSPCGRILLVFFGPRRAVQCGLAMAGSELGMQWARQLLFVCVAM